MVWTTPKSQDVSRHPEDYCLEMIQEAMGVGGSKTITMLTDTSLIGLCKMVIPVNVDSADPDEVSVASVGTTAVVYGEAEKNHNLYVIGGYGQYADRPAFILQDSNDSNIPGSIYWEIHKATMVDGVLKVVVANSLDIIDYPMFVIPIEIKAAAPDADGCGVTELTSIDFTLECGGATAEVGYLVGGLKLGYTPSDEIPNISFLQDRQLHLKSARYRRPNDLVCEIIDKTLDGASPSTVEITASSDCQIIRDIKMVIPVVTSATARAVAWDGTQGTTASIYSANAVSDVARCLVIGR